MVATRAVGAVAVNDGGDVRRKTHVLKDGERFEVNDQEVFEFSCCDCGLVHRMCIAKERNGKIGFAIERQLQATQRKRRTKAIQMNIWLLASMLFPDLSKTKS